MSQYEYEYGGRVARSLHRNLEEDCGLLGRVTMLPARRTFSARAVLRKNSIRANAAGLPERNRVERSDRRK
jgi:hypothetical protein